VYKGGNKMSKQVLFKLYFQLKEKLGISGGEEKQQINSFINYLIEENKKQQSSSQMRELLLNSFIKEIQTDNFFKEDEEIKTNPEFFQWVLERLEEFLGDELVQVKKMIKQIQLKKIAEEVVENCI